MTLHPPPGWPGAAVAAVSAQAALLAALSWPARWPPAATARWAGRAMSAAGLFIAGVAASGLGPALTPSPVPTPRAQLRRDGMFGRVRHPIYSGLLTFAAGRVLTAGLGRVPPAVALLVLLDAKTRWEERLLTERFAEYAEYAASTPRFVPALHRTRTSPTR